MLSMTSAYKKNSHKPLDNKFDFVVYYKDKNSLWFKWSYLTHASISHSPLYGDSDTFLPRKIAPPTNQNSLPNATVA